MAKVEILIAILVCLLLSFVASKELDKDTEQWLQSLRPAMLHVMARKNAAKYQKVT